MPDTTTAPMNHDYDAATGKLTPKDGPTPDGGNPGQDSNKSRVAPPMLGSGMARKAGNALGNRQSQIEAAIAAAE